jgi:hypothetical protein
LGPCTGKKKEYSLIGKIGSFKLQILSSSLSALEIKAISLNNNYLKKKKKIKTLIN